MSVTGPWVSDRAERVSDSALQRPLRAVAALGYFRGLCAEGGSFGFIRVAARAFVCAALCCPLSFALFLVLLNQRQAKIFFQNPFIDSSSDEPHPSHLTLYFTLSL